MTTISAVDERLVRIRPLTMADLPLIHRWLNEGEALRWYGLGKPTTFEEIAGEYGPLIRGEDPTRPFAITHGGQPIGYLQTYLVHDFPDYAAAIGVPSDAAAVDLFIGEAAFLHRGVGPVVLRRTLREVIFADERIGRCVICPEPANAAAIRAYEKIGFRYLRTVDEVPGGETPEYVMELTREAFLVTEPRTASTSGPR